MGLEHDARQSTNRPAIVSKAGGYQQELIGVRRGGGPDRPGET